MKVRETKCPAGSRATACFTATITNIGDRTGSGRCQLFAMDLQGQERVGVGSSVRFEGVAPGASITRSFTLVVRAPGIQYNPSWQCVPGLTA